VFKPARAASICVAVAALVLAGPGVARAACEKQYSYAGLVGTSPAHGVRARVAAVARPSIRWGHVAAWVGVSSSRADSWIQVGLNGIPGALNNVYYETARGGQPVYHQLALDVPVGREHTIGVLEVRGRPGWWRVWVNGKAASPPISLPGSHGAWQPMAMTESWNGGKGFCNDFHYSFENVSAAGAPGGSWQRLDTAQTIVDSGYRLLRRTSSDFVARAT
jgi:hypothetical protein